MAPSLDLVEAVGPTEELQTSVEFDRLNRFELLNDTTGRPRRVLKSPSQDDICSSARCNRFERLNDTTARPKLIFRKTPPPPIIRGLSASEILGMTAPAQAVICPSARLNRFELVDTTAYRKRLFRKTPPPPRSKDSEEDSEQAGAAGKCAQSKSLVFPALQCTLPSGALPAYFDERFNDLEYCDFETCDWLNNSLLGIGRG